MKNVDTRLRRLFIVLSLMAVMASSLGGYLYYSAVLKYSEQRIHKAAEEKLKVLEASIDSHLSGHLYSVKSMAGLTQVKQAVSNRTSADLDHANAILDHFQKTLEVSVCYLIDRSGDTIASSNRNGPHSFVGKNYGFRPYFTQAMQGKSSVYMALGITSKKRGVYYSYPVFSRDSRDPAGVMVIKAPTDPLENAFMKFNPQIVLLTDPDGVIFFSNHPAWLYHILWKPSIQTLKAIEQSRQFGKGPWKWTGIKKIGPNEVADDQGRNYRFYSQKINHYPGWQLVCLHSHEAIAATLKDPLLKSIGPGIAVLCSVFFLMIFFLFRKASAGLVHLKKAEKELRKSNARHSKMVANIGDVIAIIDKEGINRYKSPNVETLFGWKPEELVNTCTFDNVHPEDQASARQFFEKIIDKPGSTGTMECRYQHKTGSWRQIEFTGTNLLNDPDICGILGNYHDITERKQVEQSLRESEARFKALHNASFGGIVLHDKGLILDCNQGLSDMTGYTREELIGMDGLLLIAEQSRPKVMNNILSGYEKAYEGMGRRKNGEEFPMRLQARNVPYKGKQIRTVEFRDITDQKQAEAEKEKLQSQLLQSQKIESVGRLAGGVAHDFNNMLGVILGHTELAMEKTQGNQSLCADLNAIQKAAKRSADLTKHLLTFARKQIIEPKLLDLNQTINTIITMLERLIGENIDLVWKPCKDLWHVKMDPSQIDQILANLCVNARDAITGVGQITIETGMKTFDKAYCADHPGFTPGDFVLVEFSDTGCGMDKDTLANLFEPFFTTKETGKGPGLGLATVYGIVKQNNGFINVYSEPEKGTVFRIFLPRYHLPDKTSITVPEKKPVSGGHETILLVEDEPSILRMSRMMLERNGYKVLSAGTPADAVKTAETHKQGIDLLMTDVVMPEMNGKDLAERIQSIHPDIKILFMSGYTADVIARQGILDEGVAFINKPFSMNDICTKLRNILDFS